MRPQLTVSLLVVLAVAASAPLTSAKCIPRSQKISESHSPAASEAPAPSPTSAFVLPSQQAPVTKEEAEEAGEQDKPSGRSVTLKSISDIVAKPVTSLLSPIIKTLCTKTDYPDVCESSIATLPSAPPTELDGLGVLKLAMDAVRAKVVEARNAATDLMNDPGTDEMTKSLLDDCVESYSDVQGSLDSAQDALKKGDKATAHTSLDSARTDVDTCENGFAEREELTPVMAVHDKMLAKLASNCLAIATALD